MHCTLDEILRVERLTKRFVSRSVLGRGRTTVQASENVSFSVARGEVFVIVGESGSGKSTIARMILGSITPDSGRVFFDGKEAGAGRPNLDRIREKCQMIQQDPYDSINPRMRIGDIIAEPLEIHGYRDRARRRNRVLEVLHEVKLEPAGEIIEKYPHMLSGGQRQRVVLARALAPRPQLIVADEPVSMLDVSIRAEVLELMESLRKRHGISFIYITHDLATANLFGTRVAVLYRGRIVEMGRAGTVLLSPRHPYTVALTDALSAPDPANRLASKRIRILDPAGSEEPGGCSFRARCPYAIQACGAEPALEDRDGRQVACFVEVP